MYRIEPAPGYSTASKAGHEFDTLDQAINVGARAYDRQESVIVDTSAQYDAAGGFPIIHHWTT